MFVFRGCQHYMNEQCINIDEKEVTRVITFIKKRKEENEKHVKAKGQLN